MTDLLMISSGAVPRELCPGIVWDDAAEIRFLDMVAVTKKARPTWGDDDVVRESIWAVEADLHRKFIKAQVMRGVSCQDDYEKKEIYAGWISSIGAERAARIAGMIKDKKLCQKVLQEW